MPLLMIGSVGMSITLALMAIVFAQALVQEGGALKLEGKNGPITLVAANLYVIFFNMSWGPVMWVMLGEMFPNQIRGSGLAVSGLAQWGSNFAVTMTFPILLASIGLAGAYGLYAVCAVISIFFITKFVHETKGRELEEMEGYYVENYHLDGPVGLMPRAGRSNNPLNKNIESLDDFRYQILLQLEHLCIEHA